MSEVKLNLIDAQTILTGTIHGSVVDSCVASLSAEPETIAELEAALGRYIRPQEEYGPFTSFRFHSEIDAEPWDAGLVVIDLTSRVVAAESSYSQPQPEGEVRYHDGSQSTDILLPYQLPGDWLFVNSIEAYRWSSPRRRQLRAENPPLDARPVLYGHALLEFILKSGVAGLGQLSDYEDEAALEARRLGISNTHALWLTTPRSDLRGQSPRDVLLAKRSFIDSGMDTRAWQWSIQGEGPPCLAPDAFAYRFAGFGTHEWVVYYDLVRELLWSATKLESASQSLDADELFLIQLEELKSHWLEQPEADYDGRVPAIIIDNERKRLPLAMSPKELIIDDDCEICRMSALDAEMGFGPGFWHLDGCNMDDGFAFSSCLTVEEWEKEHREREEFNRKFNQEWEKRQQRIASGEMPDVDFDWLDSTQPDAAGPDPDMPF